MTRYFFLILSHVPCRGSDKFNYICIEQVREKKLLNITAINLNKMTINVETVQKIKQGKYSFVYLVSKLSPY